jgi:hypothetical protein
VRRDALRLSEPSIKLSPSPSLEKKGGQVSDIIAAILLAVIIISTGNYIIRMMPTNTARPLRPKPIRGEEWGLDAEVSAVVEEEFQIAFADYWTLGRPFALRLEEVACTGLGDVKVKQLSLKVIPTGEGFESEAFGRCIILDNYQSAVIHIPYAVAHQMLADARNREPTRLNIWGRRLENSTKTALITNLLLD